MNLKFCATIFVIFFISFSKSSDNFCRIKRDVLKSELETLQNTFNITESDPAPSNCGEYQNAIVKIIEKIDFDKIFNNEQDPVYQELKRKYIIDDEKLQVDYENERRNLEDQYDRKRQEIDSNGRNTRIEINQLKQEHENYIKKHNELLNKYNICEDVQIVKNWRNIIESYRPEQGFGSAPAQSTVICPITHEWFGYLKTLIDSKINTTDETSMTGDCNLQRRWFLGLNDVLQEAVNKSQSSFSIESYKISLEKLLNDKKKKFADSNFQLSQEHQRSLSTAIKQFQELNLELQTLRQNLINLKANQAKELEQLGVKLIGCDYFGLALKLVDEVESKTLLRDILTKQYETSSNEEKADQMLANLGQIKDVCKKFEALVILYNIMKASSDMESPTMIELIEQIKSSMYAARDCGVQYDQSSFLSKTLAEDPTVDRILNVITDSILVRKFDKILTFNYYHPITFGQILPNLVKKSYTGQNLDTLLKFTDELYWLLHKYDVLDQLLDNQPPKTKEDKKLFMECAQRVMNIESRFHEHDTRLQSLKNAMKRNGIQ